MHGEVVVDYVMNDCWWYLRTQNGYKIFVPMCEGGPEGLKFKP